MDSKEGAHDVKDKSSDLKENPVENIMSDLEISENDSESDTLDAENNFIDEVALKDSQMDLTEDDLIKLKEEALSYKEEGNLFFKAGNYVSARTKYTAALRLCPLQHDSERSILFANRGACFLKEGRKEEAVEDCTKALDLNPLYLKALKRRAALYEELDKLDESLDDYKKYFESDPSDSAVVQAIQRLPKKIEERNEKLKEQMLGTLKELGNKILRPFGLSTNNFQLQQDPNSGGYTVNFNQNKS